MSKEEMLKLFNDTITQYQAWTLEDIIKHRESLLRGYDSLRVKIDAIEYIGTKKYYEQD